MMAQRRFLNLEKRFLEDKLLAELYYLFMTEYLESGHLERTDSICVNKHYIYNNTKYYLPHHPVFKERSIITKMRVVFDDSAAFQLWHITEYCTA